MAYRWIVSLLAVGIAAAGLVIPAAQKAAPDGTVHRVDAEPWVVSGRTTTALRHVRQAPGGGRSSVLILGTEDPALDRDPSLAIDPVDGSVVLVWVRDDGTGPKLRATRWVDGGWSSPVTLCGPGAVVSDPQVRVGGVYVHVIWTEAGASGPSYWRAVYTKSGFTRRFGPESLPTEDAPLAPGEVVAAGGSPSSSDLFASVLAPGKIPGDPGRIHTWGMRDEPVPIGYRQAHGVPGGAPSIRRLGCGWIGPRFAVWFDSNAGFHYRVLEGDRWQGFRLVELDPDVTHGDARLLVEETLRR